MFHYTGVVRGPFRGPVGVYRAGRTHDIFGILLRHGAGGTLGAGLFQDAGPIGQS